MANVTTDRRTIKEASSIYMPQNSLNALAATNYPGGVMVCGDANGRAAFPAVANAATQRVKGVTKTQYDNSLGANDDMIVELETGPFKFDKDGTNPPTNADLGKTVFAVDNHTISRSAATGVPAGVLKAVESDGVIVGIGEQYSAAPNAAA